MIHRFSQSKSNCYKSFYHERLDIVKYDITQTELFFCAVSSKHLQCVCRHAKSYPASDRFLYHTTGARLDLAVLFTPSTPDRQNRNQVRWKTCAGVRQSTPSSNMVQTEQSRVLFQNKMAEQCLHCTEIFFSLSR